MIERFFVEPKMVLQFPNASFGTFIFEKSMSLFFIGIVHPKMKILSLKYPYYGFLKMIFHAVCNTALSEWKHPEMFEIWKCTVYKVIVSQKMCRLLIIEISNFKTNPWHFILTSTWNISILPIHLLRAQTWGKLNFALVWMKILIYSLPPSAAFGTLKAHTPCFKWNQPITAD